MSRVVYNLKEQFYEIYKCGDSEVAERKFEEWWPAVCAYPDLEKTFRKARNAIWKRREMVFGYFLEERMTNAATEALNKQIKEVLTVGRGYSFPMLRARVLSKHGVWTRQARRAALQAEREQPGYDERKRAFVKGRPKLMEKPKPEPQRKLAV